MVANPGEAESVQVGITEARRCPRRRPTDGALLLRRNRRLKVPFARLPPSEASPLPERSAGLVGSGDKGSGERNADAKNKS